METEIKYLISLLDKADIPYSPDFEENLSTFSDIFLKTADKINLTAIKQPHDVVIKHYFDSLYPTKYIPNGASIIDIGCGAGFPSIPLKLANPTLKFTLLDSLQKRLTFLDGIIDRLSLKDIRTLHARAEEAGRSALRDSFDVAVSRAVARLDILCEYCLPFVKPGGIFLCYKGTPDLDEIQDAVIPITKLKGVIEKTETYELPENAGTRTLIIIRKQAETPKEYPRNTKQMSKNAIK